ncbi:MAG: hypothetical protein U9O87_03320, partial [Verrucomicrobiota bacterium]|nr:hypothetical protein [Verrucomicrobiota bacterium]
IGGQRYFECSLTKKGFSYYLKHHDWEIKPIDSQITIDYPLKKEGQKTFSSGEYYKESQKNGGHITLVYLPEEERLFMEASTR